jgi:hypothetical protein
MFSNVETLLVAFLGARSELTGVPVAVRPPAGYDGTSPIVVVTRVGGEFSVDDEIDRALVRVDTYGRDKAGALDLTGTVRGLMWSMPQVQPLVTDVSETRGPSWLRDPGFAGANRYTTRYLLHVSVR